MTCVVQQGQRPGLGLLPLQGRLFGEILEPKGKGNLAKPAPILPLLTPIPLTQKKPRRVVGAG